MTEQSLPSVCQRWDCLDNNPSSWVCVSRGCPANCHVEVVLLTKTHSEFGHAHISVLAGQGHILPAQGNTCVHVGDSKCCKSSFLPISTLENYLTTTNADILVVYNSSTVMCQDKEGPENSKKLFVFSALSSELNEGFKHVAWVLLDHV